MKNIIALAGMISLLILAYLFDLLLGLSGLGVIAEVSEFFARRDVWLLPITFIIFALTAILLAWYVVWQSRSSLFIRLSFLVVGVIGLLYPAMLRALLFAPLPVLSISFLLSIYLRPPYLLYQAFAYIMVIGIASVIISHESAD